ncbi:hypothetical protein Klosneuvirus_3_110 [Klosneuvirus KNV1]|uniref:GIY-YIG domain-containing protein n=1 Tax=Klosneuvirus KNV1 TaxID=1977640 RepID=A0A1V0SJS1_9VIRU|nr:hypothetical protein Klosneuvirus_3_110 [Klosneuvirus KNV1]
MVNYQNGKIYKIVSNQTIEVYVGSTTDELKSRFSGHKSAYKQYQNKKTHYVSSFELMKYDDASIILIENYPCDSKQELHKKEQDCKNNTPNCINKYNAISNNKWSRRTNFKDGKIYKLFSPKNPKCYVGSTCKKLNARFVQHKAQFKMYINEKDGYMTADELLKYEDCIIELIENFPCESETELLNREAFWIRKFDCVNRTIPTRTEKEYYHDTKHLKKEYYKNKSKKYREKYKDEIKIKKKKYAENNKEVLKDKRKIHYEKNKEHELEANKKYREQNKEELACKSKMYREENKEIIRLKKKTYYDNNHTKMIEEKKKYWNENKERLNKKQSERIKCDCGMTSMRSNMIRHKKTQRHLDLIEKLNT